MKKSATSVTLRKANGQEITLPVAKLSAANIAFLKTTGASSDTAGRTLTPEEVSGLQALAKKNNGSVEIEDGKITGIQLGAIKSEVLAQFRDLQTVKTFVTYLSYSTLKDADLAVIGSLKNLTTINLDACQIDGLNGLKAIANLPHLKTLSIGEGGVDDAEIGILKNNQAIEDLDLYSHSLSNEGVKHIGQMANLKNLSLQTSPEHPNTVTDAGVAHLSTLSKLEHLELKGDAYTDKCLVSILKLPSLKSLDVSDTKISDAAKAKLKQAKPGLEGK